MSRLQKHVGLCTESAVLNELLCVPNNYVRSDTQSKHVTRLQFKAD